jgi:hypothetical protein
MLYQNDGKIEYDLEFITHSLNYKKEKVLSVLSDFDLFEVQDGFLSNKRVLRAIKEITEKSEKARASANRRYGN